MSDWSRVLMALSSTLRSLCALWAHVLTACVGLAASLLVFLVFLSIYRAYFHPLATYPGPFLAKFTNLYAAYHSWVGDIHLDVYRCHRKYGDRVRYAPNRLIFDSVAAIEDIYGHRAKTTKIQNYDILSKQAPNTLTLRDKKQHGMRRRFVSQAFSESSLRTFEPKILARADRLCTKISTSIEESDEVEGWSKATDMSQIFSHLAFDLITAVSFDVDYNTLDDPHHRHAIAAIKDTNMRYGVLMHMYQLTFPQLDRYLFPKSIKANKTLAHFIRSLVKARFKAGDDAKQDIFSFLRRCKDSESGKLLSQIELTAETALFIVAGADTTATSMSAFMHYLSESSDSYLRAAREVRETFKTREDIRMGPILNSCTFLRACIDEALRLSPPAASVPWREVEKGGTQIDKTIVPGNTEVGVGIYSIHRSPLYEDPFKYDPGRWLQSELPAQTFHTVQFSKQPYMPFLTGPRSCVGKPLAITQLMIVAARLLWEYDFAPATGDPCWDGPDTNPSEFIFEDHLSAVCQGPVLRFRMAVRT